MGPLFLKYSKRHLNPYLQMGVRYYTVGWTMTFKTHQNAESANAILNGKGVYVVKIRIGDGKLS